jgi:hypothetical protein
MLLPDRNRICNSAVLYYLLKTITHRYLDAFVVPCSLAAGKRLIKKPISEHCQLQRIRIIVKTLILFWTHNCFIQKDYLRYLLHFFRVGPYVCSIIMGISLRGQNYVDKILAFWTTYPPPLTFLTASSAHAALNIALLLLLSL